MTIKRCVSLFFAVFTAAATVAPVQAQETTTYTYDALGRLVTSSVVGGPASGTQTSTGFDPAGNRTTYTVSGVPAAVALSVNSASGAEGTEIVFTVTKIGTAAGTVTINYATSDGSATNTVDYTGTTGTLTFLATETIKTITVQTNDDTLAEGNETFSLTLSGASAGATISNQTGTGTILDNDSLPSFAVSNASAVTEGGTMTFTVTKTGSGAASVNYASAGGTATSGSDFTAVSGTLSFLAGETSKTVTVATIDDTAVESAETVLMNLSSPTGATITTAQGSGTINDNDVAPVSFAINNPPWVVEGGTLTFTVTKTGTTSTSLSVNYASAGGTATPDTDFTSVSGTLTFLPGETTKTITVATTDDVIYENLETVLMNLSAPTGGATITTAQGTGSITNNDPIPSFAVSDASPVTEGGPLTFTITRSGPSALTFYIIYGSASGTATSGSDFTPVSSAFYFQPTDTSVTISVPTIDDSIVEESETVLFNLVSVSGGSVFTDSQGTGTILDNDSLPSFAVSNASAVTEGGTMTFTVTKTGSGAASVNYASAGGTATSGSDFTAVSGTLSFLAGETSKTVTVATIDDTAVESAETVLMNLSSPTGATITTAQGSGTINDNDVAPVSFAINNPPWVVEGGTLTFTVTKTGTTSTSLSVNYASAGGTATPDTDFTSVSGTLTFLPGETTKTITVATTDDVIYENLETVLMNLSAPTGGATITTAQGTGSITNNDPIPSFAVSDASPVTEGGPLTFTITRSGPSALTFYIIYGSASGTATSGSDFTPVSSAFYFQPTDTSVTISVPTIDDSIVEESETVLFNLVSVSGGSVFTDSQGTGTILDND